MDRVSVGRVRVSSSPRDRLVGPHGEYSRVCALSDVGCPDSERLCDGDLVVSLGRPLVDAPDEDPHPRDPDRRRQLEQQTRRRVRRDPEQGISMVLGGSYEGGDLLAVVGGRRRGWSMRREGRQGASRGRGSCLRPLMRCEVMSALTSKEDKRAGPLPVSQPLNEIWTDLSDLGGRTCRNSELVLVVIIVDQVELDPVHLPLPPGYDRADAVEGQRLGESG